MGTQTQDLGLYTLTEAAAQFRNVTPRDLRKWIAARELPYVIKPNGTRRYVLLEDVQRALDNQKKLAKAIPCPGKGKASPASAPTRRSGNGTGRYKVIDFEAQRAKRTRPGQTR